MKIYSNRAEAFIQNLKANTLLVYGNDQGAVSEIERKIIKKFLPEANDMAVIDLPMDKIKEDESALFNEAASMSFFAEKKLIRITDAADSLAKILDKIVPELSPETFLLISAGELQKNSALRKFYEDSTTQSAIICYKDDEAGVRNYVATEFRKRAIQVDTDALEYLSTNLGDDKMITNNEIEKILIYLGLEKRLTLEDVLSLLADNNEITLMNLAFAVTNRDTAKLEKNLANVFGQQQNAVSIIRIVMWHFQRLIQAKALMESGMGADQVVKSLKPQVFFKQVPDFTRALNGWSKDKLTKAMDKLTQAELEAKKGLIDPDLFCHRTLLSLAA